ncbi:hypothetical protein LJC28_04345 [Dysgonomonas sp. OttesenSCG-928-D17]|nr:hypothetical protein [Dysgonomonas sp. OttesenSCG-928-D17]
MWKHLELELFRLLSEPSQVTNEEMQSAYEDFVTQVVTLSQSELNYSDFFRILNLSRIEFDSLGSSPLCGQGEKCN